MERLIGWTTAGGVLLLATLVQAGGGVALEALQGDWFIVSVEKDGTKTTFAAKDMPIVTFKGETYLLPSAKGFTQSKSGKIKLHPGKSRGIDLLPDDGPYKGKTLLGIYRIDEDTMRACYALPSKPRPVAYTTEPDSGRVVVNYKRKE